MPMVLPLANQLAKPLAHQSEKDQLENKLSLP
jgi:hypothetical protein